jgi:hypothetical protein
VLRGPGICRENVQQLDVEGLTEDKIKVMKVKEGFSIKVSNFFVYQLVQHVFKDVIVGKLIFKDTLKSQGRVRHIMFVLMQARKKEAEAKKKEEASLILTSTRRMWPNMCNGLF